MPANSTGILRTPTNYLVLEIHEAGEVRQLETTATKCLVGSGPNCQLQLNGPNVAPIHCFLLRGPRGTAFRAVAPLEINGQPANEGWLQPGDRLSLGDCQIVIVSEPSPPPQPAETSDLRQAAAAPVPVPAPLETVAVDNMEARRAKVREILAKSVPLASLKPQFQPRPQSDQPEAEVAVTEPEPAPPPTRSTDVDEMEQRIRFLEQQLAEYQAVDQESSSTDEPTALRNEPAPVCEPPSREPAFTAPEPAGFFPDTADEPVTSPATEFQPATGYGYAGEFEPPFNATPESPEPATEPATEPAEEQTVLGTEGAYSDDRDEGNSNRPVESWQESLNSFDSGGAPDVPDELPAAAKPESLASDLPATETETKPQPTGETPQNTEEPNGQAASQSAVESSSAAGFAASYESFDLRPDPEEQAGLPAESSLDYLRRSVIGNAPQDPAAFSEKTTDSALTPQAVQKDEEALEFQAPTPGAPVSTLDVLKRMGTDFPLDDVDEPPNAEPAQPENPLATALGLDDQSTQPQSPPRHEPQPSWETAAGEEEPPPGDESIESYMNRLLERVRGGQSQVIPAPGPLPAVTPIPAADNAEAACSSDTSLPTPAATAEDKPEPFDLHSMAPRTEAPERAHDWAAMRDLANKSARDAIVVSEHKRFATQALSRTVVMFLLIVLGFLLNLLTPAYNSPVFWCALACYALAIYFFVKIGRLMRQVAQIQQAKNQVSKAVEAQRQGVAARPQYGQTVGSASESESGSSLR